MTARASHRACLAATLLVIGCRTGQATTDEPALIVRPTAESRAALENAIGSALQGAQVTVAADALTRDSVLLVERTARRDFNRLPLGGREAGLPERFQLLKTAGPDGIHCVLVHERTGRRFVLAATLCSAPEIDRRL